MTSTTSLDQFLTTHMMDYARARECYAYSLPTEAVEFANLPALRAAVTASGSHFFDRDAVKFFNSKNHALVAGRFLVVSIQDGDYPREYTVRWVYKYDGTPTLQVERLNTGFATLQEAIRAGAALARLIDEQEA